MGGESRDRTGVTIPLLSSKPVGQVIESIDTARLLQFTDSGQYYEQGLRAKFYDAVAAGENHIQLSVYSPPDLSRPTFEEAASNKFRPTHVGESFGPSWSTHWFEITVTVPKHMREAELLEFHWDANNEGMVWTQDGIPLQGLTGGGERVEWILPDSFRDGKPHVFYIEMACNKMMGNTPSGNLIQPPSPNNYFLLHTAMIAAINLEARALYIDFWIIGDAAREFSNDSWEKHLALQVCNTIMDAFIAGNGSQEAMRECRKIAQQYIGKHVDSERVYDSDNEAIVTAIGHCHIDTCWLWPWAETKRKVARSWLNQCDLMDRYPEHRFTVSQAQQYKWLKQYYPTAFDRVKSKVKEGKFLPIGGSWIEHDTNLPSGESLVRQFLYGQRFFESHFGERCTTFWLPDTFGYSSQLPQLSRQAGMSRFFTQKLSWNNINTFPHTTFRWVALDGSQVMCHMTPSETYTANAHFGDVKRSVTQHKSMNQDNTSLLVFGKGDGGGGPTREMLDKLRRCRGLSDQIGRLPRVKMGDSVDDFFAKLEAKAAKGTEFVTWYGELYFELHRGTYTTQARTKRNNRQAEIMLRDLEFLASLATIKSESYKYPKADLDEMWEHVLLCQFHDCLPGSSIEMCYDDTEEVYAKVFEIGRKAKADALSPLGMSRAIEGESATVALNTLPWSRSEFVEIDTITPSGQQKEHFVACGGPGPITVKPYLIETACHAAVSITAVKDGVFKMANAHFKVEVAAGCITSLVDLKADREVVPRGGQANQLVIFDDKPLYWQAWDVEVYHLNSRKVLQSGKSKILETGPCKVSVVTETQISAHSWVKTIISLPASIGEEPGYVTMDCEVEWRETMQFLKVEFPVDIVNTEASYETQYGIVRRPTHYNTTWDMAKFEVCCHKFADLSEADYGVSILNDSKYGFATCGNLMRLSLLRSPKAPDGHADMGRHHMKWSIMPHLGPLTSQTVRTAYNFNHPMAVYSLSGPARSAEKLFRSIQLRGSESLILDCIKRGEDDEDVSQGGITKREGRSIILRIYEAMGGKSRGTIKTKLPVKKITKCNLLEDDVEECKTYGKLKCDIELRAFEVATFRLHLS